MASGRGKDRFQRLPKEKQNRSVKKDKQSDSTVKVENDPVSGECRTNYPKQRFEAAMERTDRIAADEASDAKNVQSQTPKRRDTKQRLLDEADSYNSITDSATGSETLLG
ncbi:MAG: hypothetical protein WKF71_20225 [Pyrinomonadaceae bacterium]